MAAHPWRLGLATRHETTVMDEQIKAWPRIGCGIIEVPQTCIGICQDRDVEFICAFEYDDALAQPELARGQVSVLLILVRRLAWTTPRGYEWEHSDRALQAHALLATPQMGPSVAELCDGARL